MQVQTVIIRSVSIQKRGKRCNHMWSSSNYILCLAFSIETPPIITVWAHISWKWSIIDMVYKHVNMWWGCQLKTLASSHVLDITINMVHIPARIIWGACINVIVMLKCRLKRVQCQYSILFYLYSWTCKNAIWWI